jgi:hypothetical protein
MRPAPCVRGLPLVLEGPGEPLYEGRSGTAFGKCEGLTQFCTVKINRPHGAAWFLYDQVVTARPAAT